MTETLYQNPYANLTFAEKRALLEEVKPVIEKRAQRGVSMPARHKAKHFFTGSLNDLTRKQLKKYSQMKKAGFITDWEACDEFNTFVLRKGDDLRVFYRTGRVGKMKRIDAMNNSDDYAY